MNSLPALLSPPSNSIALLHAIDWQYFGFLGPHYTEPDSARCDVLVLLPERSWYSGLLEGMDHTSSDRSVCD